jgi:hypothetical protein
MKNTGCEVHHYAVFSLFTFTDMWNVASLESSIAKSYFATFHEGSKLKVAFRLCAVNLHQGQ